MKSRLILSLGILLSLLVLPLASSSAISRSFSKSSVQPGEAITVTVDVAISGGETYYLIDETVPRGWTIVNPDPETQAGHVKWAVFTGATSTSYTYDIRAPQNEGGYSFTGIYMFGGMKTEGQVAGESTVTVAQASAGPEPRTANYGFLIAPAIILGAVFISLAIFISRSRSRKHA